MSVIFKSIRSDSLEFIVGGKDSDFNIPSDGLTGIDFPNTNLYTIQNAVGDGMVVTGKNVESRIVKLKAEVKNSALNEVVRRRVQSFFNPKYTYRNYITYMGVERWIDAELDGFSCPSENIHRKIKLTATFFSADPYFKSIDSYGKDIASVTGAWGFPYIETAAIKPKFSVFNFAKNVEIFNDGDVETFCVAVIRANGEITNPKIMKDNKYVRMIGGLVTNDVVIMDFDKKTITKNGVNAITLVDKTSNFTDMQFEVGMNTISFGADAGENNMSVTIYYNKLYGGM